ncbi:B3 domain-containing protein Os03g0212300-like [Phalaenopsis equestris]|uniref:B3 domain-containing protein Os03g0212300-like n=1 Tax=Phalaenopsis equestris TaxID=78828 RepID=UPI0009E3A74B|nr:B3 domain-containing protein Os03g0212300-like [Phalaenopsis equestris]
MDFNVKVFDLTACEVEYSHEICYGKMLEASSPLNKQEESKASKTAEKLFKQFCKSLGPHFCITLKFCNLRSRPYLNIPFRFLTSHKLERKSRVILIDPKGRSSLVRITIKKRRPIIQCCFSMGWHEFCLRNHLSAGDKCIFEIKSEQADAYIVHVHIIRE